MAVGGGQLKIWTGDGAGNWTEAAVVATGTPGGYSALRTGADFDHNGRPDLAFVVREGNWPSDRNYAYAFREASPVDSLSVFPVFPRGGERFLGGSVQFIDWWSEAPGAAATRVRLELSTQGPGGPWQLVADSLRNAGRFQWLVPPGAVSANCYVRYTAYGPGGSASSITPRPFTIGNPTGIEEDGPRLQNAGIRRATPNPARDRLAVELGPDVAGVVRAVLCDASGREVRRWQQTQGCESSRSMLLWLGDLAAGAYFLRVETQAGALVRRVVKAR